MPYICLANANLPGGVLQITDLWPNESQRNGAIDPPGQTRYLRRVALDRVQVNTTSGVVEGFRASAAQPTFEGLHAYLVDKVEPGGMAQATATITLVGPVATDRITIKGIVFEFAAGANDLVGKAGTAGDPFIVGLGAGVNAAAANLTLALNDAGDVIPAFAAAAPATIHVVATNVGAPSAVVRIDAVTDPGAVVLVGPTGDLAVSTDAAARITVPAIGRMARTNELWTATNLLATATALLLRVNTGLAMTLADIDVVLLAQVNGELVRTLSNSQGSLAELLSVLAGRAYRIPVSASKFTVAVAPDTVHIWDITIRGSFTTPNTVFDSEMTSGEWRPMTRWIKHGKEKQSVVSGGDVVNNEIAGVRTTVDTTHFASSLATGQLSQYASGITLFPDAEVQAFVSDWTRRTNRQATLVNQRVVTVYDDDGTLLA